MNAPHTHHFHLAVSNHGTRDEARTAVLYAFSMRAPDNQEFHLQDFPAPQITAAEHLRYRLPSEKPTPEDCCTCGGVFAFVGEGDAVWCSGVVHALPANTICWLPASLPAHLIPAPEKPEDKMRREFEEEATKLGIDLARTRAGDKYFNPFAVKAFKLWQAAREHTTQSA